MRGLHTPEEAMRLVRAEKQSFQLMFNQPAGQRILEALAQFCYAYETTYDADPRLDARKQGRRDVWLMIQRQLKLTDDDLYKIATGGYVPPPTEDEEDNG